MHPRSGALTVILHSVWLCVPWSPPPLGFTMRPNTEVFRSIDAIGRSRQSTTHVTMPNASQWSMADKRCKHRDWLLLWKQILYLQDIIQNASDKTTAQLLDPCSILFKCWTLSKEASSTYNFKSLLVLLGWDSNRPPRLRADAPAVTQTEAA